MKAAIQHEEPVHGDKATGVLPFGLDDDLESRLELLPVQQLTTDTYEICAIPFFLYEVMLGDVLRVEDLENRRYRVLHSSEYFGFRLHLDCRGPRRNRILRMIRRRGYLFERISAHGLSVAVAGVSEADAFAKRLLRKERRGWLEYETIR